MADEAAESIRNVHTRISDVSARLQNLRNLLNSERHTATEQRRAIEALDEEVDHMNYEQQLATLDQTHDRRRSYIEPANTRPPPPMPTALNPSNLVRSRRRAFRPSERLTRSQRERLHQSANLMPSPSYSIPPPRPSPPLPSDHAAREYAAEAQANRESRFKAKRRKLDDGTYEDESRAITYGWKGQVVPGQLQLDIISCDGGEYSDPHVPINSLPQNVLQDDASVYCTKSNRCNMLLKHSSGMPFTLTKMIFKAPRSGYDAPIQEGMVFVALDDVDLLEKTARYEIHYSPKSYRYHRQRFDAHRASQEYLTGARPPLTSIDRSRYLHDPREPPPAWSRYPENDPVLDSAVVPGFAVTTGDPSDDEAPPPDSPTQYIRPEADFPYPTYTDRYRPVYADSDRPPAGYEYSAPTSDSEGDGISLGEILRTGDQASQDDPDPDAATDEDADEPDLEPAPRTVSALSRPVSHRRSTPSRIGLRSHATAPSGSVDPADTTSPVGYERLSSDNDTTIPKVILDASAAANLVTPTDTLAPHARFFIPPHKRSIEIKFDPPVAGKIILIKLWASCPNANIDIQSISAHGYGGPRFFPGFEMR